MSREDRETEGLQREVNALTEEFATLNTEQVNLQSAIDNANTELKALDQDTEREVRRIKEDSKTKKGELEANVRDSKRQIERNKNRIKELTNTLDRRNIALTDMKRQLEESIKKKVG